MKKTSMYSAVLGIFVAGTLVVASPAVAADFTFTDAPSPAPTEIDSTSVARTIPVTGVGELTNVTVTLDFSKVGGTCAIPGTDFPFADEIVISLASPAGTSVMLIQLGTYDTGTSGDRVQVTLDDSAAALVGVNLYPESGTFRPSEALAAFVGEDPTGDWTLTVTDVFTFDPLCYFGASLTLTDASTTVTPTPVPPADPTPPSRISTAIR